MKRFFLALLLPAALSASGQKYTLAIIETGRNQPILGESIPYKRAFASPEEREKELKNVLLNLYNLGYLAASVDSVKTDSLGMVAYYVTGHQYEWASLRKGNVAEGLLNQTGFRDKLYSGRPFRPRQMSALFESIIRYCENHGYPFASVQLDTVQFNNNGITASLNLDKNKLVTIDSIEVKGSANISEVYLYNYLGLKAGGAYNESQIQKISTRLKELPFLTEKQPNQVIFTQDYTKLQLHLDHKRASTLNGILGLLPGEQPGKIQITGDARLKLQNSFGRGEVLDFNWRKLQARTQDLKIKVNYPFVMNTPLGVDFNLKFYKRDTIFNDFKRNFGLQYLFIGSNYIKAFVEYYTSDILMSRQTLLALNKLPEFLDIQSTSYGIGIRHEKLDYRLNPRRGFAVEMEGSVGNKNIRKNPNIKEELYEQLKLTTVQYNAIGEADCYLPLLRRGTVNLGVQGGYLYNENLLRNELFRFGGLKTLRGFDEESLNGSAFSVFTLELRYLLEQNSYAYTFTDVAWYENKAKGASIRQDWPYGFGAGLSFETKAGIFSINYALGAQQQQPILLKTGKVHFGFVNYF